MDEVRRGGDAQRGRGGGRQPVLARPWQVVVAGLALAVGLVVLDRLDAGLAQMQAPGGASGGFGAVASPATLLDRQAAVEIAAGWERWEDPGERSLRPSGALVSAYWFVDVLLVVLPLTLLLRAAVAASSLPPGVARVRAADVARDVAARAVLLYAAADVAETTLLLALWEDLDPSEATVVGVLSLLKLLAVGSVLLVLLAPLLAGLERHVRARAPAADRPVLAVGLRGQVVVLAALVGVLLVLSGDLGRQVDDVVVRAAVEGWPALVATLAALALSAALVLGARATLAAYVRAPEPGREGWGAVAVGGLALFALGCLVLWDPADLLDSWSAPGALLLVLGAGVALVALVSWLLPSRGEGAGAPVPPAQVAEPVAPPAWLVPALAATGPLALAVAALRAAVTLWIDGEDLAARLLLWSGVLLALALVVAVLVRHLPPVPPAPATGWRGPPRRWALAALALLAAGALADPLWWMPVGTVTVLFAAATVLSVVVTALVLLGDAWEAPPPLRLLGVRRTPLLAGAVLLGALVSVVDRQAPYYDARLSTGTAVAVPLPAVTSAPGTAPAPTAEGRGEGPLAQRLLAAWLEREGAGSGTSAGQERRTVPLVLVAASGGGIRGAYWTALTWECLFGEDLRRSADLAAACPGDLDGGSVLLASGVSGSSVGLAMVRAHELATADTAADAAAVPAGGEWLAGAFAGDFVAPALAAAVFRDLPNSVLRLPLEGWDRAGSLERAWERHNPRMDGGFSAAATVDGERPRFPLLLLNGTSVEDGCRLAVSAVRLGPSSRPVDDCLSSAQFTGPGARTPDGVLAATRDLLDVSCDRDGRGPLDVRLSTAALLSARFPFVSPSAGLTSCTGPAHEEDERARTYVLDGGLLENSGADAVVELWAALEPHVRELNAGASAPVCVVPRLLLLDNSFAGPGPGRPGGRSPQLLAPAAGALGVLGSQHTGAQQEAIIALTRSVEAAAARCGAVPGPAVVHLYPRARPGSQAPLGWTLAGPSRDALREELAAPENAEALRQVAGWFARHDGG